LDPGASCLGAPYDRRERSLVVSRASLAVHVVFVFGALGIWGCVDDRPVVVAGRDGGVAVGPQPAEPSDLAPIDPPGCQRCAQVVASGVYSSRLCSADGAPSSAERLVKYFDCACRIECTVPCATHCSGSAPDSACSDCVSSQCAKVKQSCLEASR